MDMIDPNEAPPGYRAECRLKTVDGDSDEACRESGGCAFLGLYREHCRGTRVPGFPAFSCRPALREDKRRVLFKKTTYGNEEED